MKVFNTMIACHFTDAFTDVWALPDMVAYSPNAYFFAAATYFMHIGVFCLTMF